jgi:thiamine pyrophosphate-dependent acetolactate synthase large subunit-like protein
MAEIDSFPTGADVLVRRLRDWGVRHVFGYPGGPLTPIHDAIYREPGIRHILARDERGAGFMADGYARATGKPGVVLAVCGPGVLNVATPLAGAFSDSVPVLLIGGQVSTSARGGIRSGYYHENDQLAACAHFTKFQACLSDVSSIVTSLDQAWLRMTGERPGPAFLDAPINVMAARIPGTPWPVLPQSALPREPASRDVDDLAKLVASWNKPLIMVGGGVISSGAELVLVDLAQRLGAPVFHTFMGKGAIPSDHPLCAGTPWKEGTSDATEMATRMSPLFALADGMLAAGCRFTQVITGSWALKPPESLVQIDIDPEELGRHYPLRLGIHADARLTLQALLERLPRERRPSWAPATPAREPRRIGGLDLLGPLRRTIPADALISADVTQLGYAMLVDHPVKFPRTFFHPAAAISMGFGLPAALGAKAAFPEKTLVTVMGDGCFQMTGMELATAVQEKLPVVVVLINDRTLSLIKAIQQRRYGGRFIGVDLQNPDFSVFARAYGVQAWQVQTGTDFEKALREAIASREPALVEVQITYENKKN